jgi:hypothetical protein
MKWYAVSRHVGLISDPFRPIVASGRSMLNIYMTFEPIETAGYDLVRGGRGRTYPPTDTRIASEPQRFLLGLVLRKSFLKKGLDLLWALWVSRSLHLLLSPRPPLGPIWKKRHLCRTASICAR